jgi:4-methyl-5(b-hydroxyethyl)-thiazole monophosphate biosynthesis
MKKVAIILAPGFELIEALTPVDVLKRAELDVTLFSLDDSLEIASSLGVKVIADKPFSVDEISSCDMIVLPGGYPGYENLGKKSELIDVLKYYLDAKKFVGAICGAPSVLAEHKLIDGRTVTSHTAVREFMENTNYKHEAVVRDNNLITGMGAGVSLQFALELASCLVSSEVLEKVKKGMEIF